MTDVDALDVNRALQLFIFITYFVHTIKVKVEVGVRALGVQIFAWGRIGVSILRETVTPRHVLPLACTLSLVLCGFGWCTVPATIVHLSLEEFRTSVKSLLYIISMSHNKSTFLFNALFFVVTTGAFVM